MNNLSCAHDVQICQGARKLWEEPKCAEMQCDWQVKGKLWCAQPSTSVCSTSLSAGTIPCNETDSGPNTQRSLSLVRDYAVIFSFNCRNDTAFLAFQCTWLRRSWAVFSYLSQVTDLYPYHPPDPFNLNLICKQSFPSNPPQYFNFLTRFFHTPVSHFPLTYLE